MFSRRPRVAGRRSRFKTEARRAGFQPAGSGGIPAPCSGGKMPPEPADKMSALQTVARFGRWTAGGLTGTLVATTDIAYGPGINSTLGARPVVVHSRPADDECFGETGHVA